MKQNSVVSSLYSLENDGWHSFITSKILVGLNADY
jgi:hypothetical protein